jgi:hypothetical protein
MTEGVNEQELRDMIRASIARHVGTGVGAHPPDSRPHLHAPDPAEAFRATVSHVRFTLAQGGDGDGACLIEPAVRCSHCGFCQSYGH